MSWNEYSDMFKKVQNNKTDYLLYIFDVKNSKKGYSHKKIKCMMKNITSDINTYFPKALVKEEYTFNAFYVDNYIQIGDLFGFVVNPKYISKDQILNIFINYKMKFNISESFHYDSGFFETFDWVKGSEFYYIGYCIQELESRSKKNGYLI